MTLVGGIVAGIAVAIGARALLTRALLFKLRRDVARLSEGDLGPMLAAYHDEAVLHFNDGPHRWAGKHHGRAAIERFLEEFVNAGIGGEIKALWIGGAPWAMTMLVRFDDCATGPDGERLYENSTVLWVRTRWGKIVEQRDFYEDTGRIDEFEQRLQELGIEPVAAEPGREPV